MKFIEVWSNILNNKGKSFTTIKNKEFIIIEVSAENVKVKIENGNIYPIEIEEFEDAYKIWPVSGPGELSHQYFHNSYVFSILNEIFMNTSEQNFQNEMLNTYKEAKKLGYKPTRFLQMIDEYGAVETAKRLLASEDNLSDGVTKLWELGRLDLSMESIVIKPEYKELFTEQEIKIAEKRLKDLGYIK